MNIYIYTTSKNESHHVGRFMASCAEADGVYILDTGSTDDTVRRLRTLGAAVSKIEISPWRFDTARNLALGLVPKEADVCIALDLDEVLNPGWRAALEAAWVPGITRGRYEYIWSHNADGSAGVTFYADKWPGATNLYWKNLLRTMPTGKLTEYYNERRASCSITTSSYTRSYTTI